MKELLNRVIGLRRPRRLSSVLLRRLRISHWFTIQTSGVRLRFTPTVWGWVLWEQPDYFRADTQLLRRWLRRGDVMVDCGANVGLLAVVAAQCVGNTGTVYAIEPHPRVFHWLSENVRLNGQHVVLLHSAVGESTGEVLFSDGPLDDGNHVLRRGDGISVPMRTLDELIPQSVSSVRLLKIDVEGYEKFAVEGGQRVTSISEAIYFESSEQLFGRYGYNSLEFLNLLRDRGFTVVRLVEEANRLVPLPHDYVSREIENLLALRDVGTFVKQSGYIIESSRRITA